MGFPNFLIIGAPRCGTDLLLYSLNQHPEICFSKKREVHFFDRNFDKGMPWYSHFFQECEGSLIGEKTANYFVNRKAAKKIYDFSPEIKLIISMRNPIYRAFSHYTNWLGKSAINPKTSFRECLTEHPEIINIGFYVNHLKNYLQYFSPENIHILIFENLINNTENEINRIVEFLGTATSFQLKFRKKNESPPLPKFKILNGKLGQIAYKHVFSKMKPDFLNIIYQKSKTITSDDYNYLKNIYQEGNAKLFELLKIKNVWDD